MRLDTWHWSYLVLLSSLLTGYQRVICDYFELATHALPQQQLICCLNLDVDWCAHRYAVETNVKVYTSIE